jgi:NAD(P)-dependent dehydrogenase (short-subunit alcohol dehydrogenase family)
MDILVVGGTSGIGQSVTEKLVDRGHRVWVSSRNKPTNPVDGVTYLSGDILEDELELNVESLDGLVYCPGSINLKPFNRLKEEDFHTDFNINVMGAIRALQQTYPLLKKGQGSSVVLFSTVAVSQGMPYHTSTAASKGAVEGLARSLAAEWAPSIRVNVIAPSITDTPMASRLLSSDERKDNSAKRHPLNRVGSPADIAGLTAYLLSEDASWMTGQVLGMDGGMSTLRTL